MGARTWVLGLSVAALVGTSVLASDPAFALPRSPCGAGDVSTVALGKGYVAFSSSLEGGAEYESTVDTYDTVYNVKTNLPKNLLGQPTGILGGVVRDGLGRVTQYALQAFDIPTYVSKTYEPGTGRLSTYRVDRANVATPDVNATFAYNPAGGITSIADVPDAATPSRSDRQCFQYTWAGELAEAWGNGEASCASTPSFVASGAAPYWNSWSFDAAHRRTSQVEHGANDISTVSTTYAYPSATSSPNGGVGGPHAASSVSSRVGQGAVSTSVPRYDASWNATASVLPDGSAGTFTWDARSRLDSVSAAGVSGQSSYVYDADGSLLAQDIEP